MPEQPFDDERLSAYIDGELTDAEREQFERLIEQRPDYRQAIDELRTLRERIKALPAHGLGGDFAERVLRKAELATLVGPGEPVTSKESASWLSRNKTLALIAGLAACLLAMIVLPSQTEKEPAVAALPAERVEFEEADGLETQDAGATDNRGGEATNEMFAHEPRSGPPVAAPVRGLAESDADVAELNDAPTAELRVEAATESVVEGDDPRFQPSASGLAGVVVENDQLGGAVLEFVAANDPEYRRLTEEARSLWQQIEPESATWDIVVATELRGADDWRMLHTALVSNQLQLEDPSQMAARKTASESMALPSAKSKPTADSFGGTLDAQRFNEDFLSKLKANESLARKSPAEKKKLAGHDEDEEVDTHLLYVEGTKSQIANFMQSLPGARGAQLSSTGRSSDLADLDHAVRFDQLLQRDAKDQGHRLSRSSAKDRPLRQGRAVHLGQSSTKRSTLNARQQRAQPALAAAPPVPMSAQRRRSGQPMGRAELVEADQQVDELSQNLAKSKEQTFREQTGEEEGAPEGEELGDKATADVSEPVLRGLIILQDITGPSETGPSETGPSDTGPSDE